MDLELDGKLALITGATKGIGRAIAQRLLAEGAAVVVHGRSPASVSPAVDELVAAGAAPGAVHGAWADLATAAGASALLDQVAAVGSPDIVVNNAAEFWAAPLFELADDDWYRSLETNLLAGVRLSRALVPAMVERGWGRVVCIASDYGVQVNPAMVHYSVAKAAVIAFARGVAVTTRGSGVTANTVIAGPTWTEGASGFLDGFAGEGTDVEELKRSFFEPGGLLGDSLIGRYSEPGEIADMVAFVCSPRASSVTGSALRAEGGTIKSAF